MDEIRFKRYKEKINYIINNINDLPFKPKNKFEKRGIFYSLQTSIESIVDLVAMTVKDLGSEVKDDATNIDFLTQQRDINLELAENLKKANGLRNLLVHRYNDIDEKIIMDSVKEIKTLLLDWIEQIEMILNGIKDKKSN
ncbi:MAG: DUF86 domain-containing protein [Candidatus Lokiarchaeota archaeon]|nr:DUF86 domain-containing protein [Candidatus Lokiarchaeota archaeon]MBD3338807.1 DUF86 domain-containing protein [Candidatus Lokiarchaeota archaeon]